MFYYTYLARHRIALTSPVSRPAIRHFLRILCVGTTPRISGFSLFYIPWFPNGFDRDELIELQYFANNVMHTGHNSIRNKPSLYFMIYASHIFAHSMLNV